MQGFVFVRADGRRDGHDQRAEVRALTQQGWGAQAFRIGLSHSNCHKSAPIFPLRSCTSPPWIVRGDYAASRLESRLRAGPLRSNLGSPELQAWLPATLLRFARATGAGGFSFDYTYFEERPPISSQPIWSAAS